MTADAPDPRPAVPVVVVAHDPAWQPQAAALLAELRAALGPLVLRAEHIGSTSIPGMAAKPVLDVQVSVADLDEAAGAFERPLAERGSSGCRTSAITCPPGGTTTRSAG